MAAVPAYAARWLLAQAARGPVSGQTVRAEALRLRQDRRPDLAAQLEVGWTQLRLASSAWQRAMDEHALDDGGKVPAFVDDSASAKARASRASSGVDTVEVTRSEAAARLGVTPQRVGQLLKVGALTGRKFGRSWLVDVASLEAAREGREAS